VCVCVCVRARVCVCVHNGSDYSGRLSNTLKPPDCARSKQTELMNAGLVSPQTGHSDHLVIPAILVRGTGFDPRGPEATRRCERD